MRSLISHLTYSGSSTPQNSCSAVTYIPSYKLYKENKQEILNTAGEIKKEQLSLMDSYPWTCQDWSTNKELHQLCADTEFSLKDQYLTIGTDEEQESRELSAISMTRWWTMLSNNSDLTKKMIYASSLSTNLLSPLFLSLSLSLSLARSLSHIFVNIRLRIYDSIYTHTTRQTLCTLAVKQTCK